MISWEYLAGFIDADGCITSCNKKSYCVTMIQTISEKKNMMLMRDFLENNGIKTFNCERENNNHMFVKNYDCKNTITIGVKHQKSLLFFLNKIKHHLLLKRDKADEAILWLEKRIEIREKQKMAPKKQITNKYWSKEEINKMIELLDNGYSNLSVAGILGRSANSVNTKLQRMKNELL